MIMGTRKPVPDQKDIWTCYCHSGIKKAVETLEGNVSTIFVSLGARVKYTVFNLLIVVLLVVLGSVVALNFANYKTITKIESSITIIQHDLKKVERSINGGGEKRSYDFDEKRENY